jgi:hypothetical protein
MRIDQFGAEKHNWIIWQATWWWVWDYENVYSTMLSVEPYDRCFREKYIYPLATRDLDFSISVGPLECKFWEVSLMYHQVSIETGINLGGKAIIPVCLLQPQYRPALLVNAPSQDAQSHPPTLIGPLLW